MVSSRFGLHQFDKRSLKEVVFGINTPDIKERIFSDIRKIKN